MYTILKIILKFIYEIISVIWVRLQVVKNSCETRMEWHTCSSSIDKKKSRVRFSFFARSTAFRRCEFLYLGVANCRTRASNDANKRSGYPGWSGSREETVWKNKGRPVERMCRTVRYESPEEVDSSTKMKRKRNRFTAGY